MFLKCKVCISKQSVITHHFC